MKKNTLFALFFVAFFLTSTTTKAQIFEEGKSFISAGYGFVGFGASIYKSILDGTDVKIANIGPLYFKYEYAVSENIGIGLVVANIQNNFSADYTVTENGQTRVYTESLKRSNTSIMARLNWHFGESDKFDPYFGFGLGYRTGGWRYSNTNPNDNTKVDLPTAFPFGFETTVGARYFFSPNIGLYTEFGLAKSVVQFGVTASF
jgi:outer membrane protein W